MGMVLWQKSSHVRVNELPKTIEFSGGGPLASELQQVNINVISNEECAGRTSFDFINEGNICVFDGENQTGACNVSTQMVVIALVIRHGLPVFCEK